MRLHPILKSPLCKDLILGVFMAGVAHVIESYTKVSGIIAYAYIICIIVYIYIYRHTVMTLDIKNVVTSGHCGRILTTILYLNPEWRDADGGSIRLFEVGRETCAIGPRVLSNSNLIFF